VNSRPALATGQTSQGQKTSLFDIGKTEPTFSIFPSTLNPINPQAHATANEYPRLIKDSQGKTLREFWPEFNHSIGTLMLETSKHHQGQMGMFLNLKQPDLSHCWKDIDGKHESR
jgi:hypothetical protein